MSSDLFSLAQENSGAPKKGPLASRVRPLDFEHIFGHEKLLSPGKPLRQWIETDKLPSLVLWGPPGCGKTTLAQVISKNTQSHFEKISAVQSGVKDLKEISERARERFRMSKRKTILFVDEIHRFNKSQQDALLHDVEDGTVTLIGATTENPSFELNSALLSRARVIKLEALSDESVSKILKNALTDPDGGLGGFFEIDQDAMDVLVQLSEGDARRALGFLETIALADTTSQMMTKEIIQKILSDTSIKNALSYSTEERSAIVSAFIKSIRGSDPQAGLYYLARLIESGEDPVFIARRLVILASEDVGNADPRAISLAISVKDAVELVGMPEGRIPLAQAVTYLALAPKSNAAYAAIDKALEEVRESGALPVPMHLKNANSEMQRRDGYGKGYRYAHQDPTGLVKQVHLPDELKGKVFYEPKNVGFEIQLKEKLDRIQNLSQ